MHQKEKIECTTIKHRHIRYYICMGLTQNIVQSQLLGIYCKDFVSFESESVWNVQRKDKIFHKPLHWQITKHQQIHANVLSAANALEQNKICRSI